jgi:N-acetylneuraminate synthase
MTKTPLGRPHTVVIAEVGVNHNGSLETARQLVKVAARAGADYVKFQTFQADLLAAVSAPKAPYQARSTPFNQSHFDMLKGLELTHGDHAVLLTTAQESGIAFLSTPFDSQSLRFLVTELRLETIKIGSAELFNLPLLVEVGAANVGVILSTGMAEESDVALALGALTHGVLYGADRIPKVDDLVPLWEAHGQTCGLAARLTLLQCTSEYPSAVEHVNLRVMRTLSKNFNVPVGLSDHTSGIHIPLAAAALGAHVIEKHITLTRNQPGPDHHASLEPDEFAEMVAGIRDIERALGDGIKKPSSEELLTKAAATRSLTAARNISRGDIITADDIRLLRPGSGEPASALWSWIGRPSPRDFALGELLHESP